MPRILAGDYVAPFFRFQSFSELLRKFILAIGYDFHKVSVVVIFIIICI
jgi:hypothetical protein